MIIGGTPMTLETPMTLLICLRRCEGVRTEFQADVTTLNLDPIIVGNADNRSNAAANQRLPDQEKKMSEVPPKITKA